MTFIPPLFTKFGKTASDLLNQKFDVKKGDLNHEAVVKTRANNTAITTTVTSEDAGLQALNAKVKAVYVDKSFGDVTVEYNTAGKVKTNLKLNKLQKGLVVNAEAATGLPLKACPAIKAGADYAQDGFSSQLEFNQQKNSVLATAVVGAEGFSTGVGAVIDINKIKNNELPSLDFAAQYEDGNLIATVALDKSDIVVSLYHRISSALKVASQLLLTNKGNSLGFASEYALDNATSVKGKIQVFDSKEYLLGGYVCHRLTDPSVVISLSSVMESKGTSPIFGVHVGFGDN